MGLRGLIVLAVVVVTGLSTSVATGSWSPPWKPIISGGGAPQSGRPYGLVIASRAGLKRFTPLWVFPAWRVFAHFDFQQNAVVVVEGTDGDVTIVRMVRTGKVLQVGIAPRYPGQAPTTGRWEAVSVPKRVLGRPLPPRVVFPWN
jgi:hypothetical protein